MFSKAGYFSVCVAVLGSFLFGFQTAIIAGALPFIAADFVLVPWQEGLAVASVLITAFIGVLFSGSITDALGRKKTIALEAAVFTLGTAVVCLSSDFSSFLIGRAITGIGVGLISMLGPLYLAEISPTAIRGKITALHQLFVTIGILGAYFVSLVFIDTGSWKAMFALGLLPSCIQLACVYFIMESDSYFQLKELMPDKPLKELFSPTLRPILWMGIVLNVLQQLSGINSIIYFAPKVLTLSGVSSQTYSMLATFAIGLVNCLSTLVAVRLLDRIGRRALLLWGITGMVVSVSLLSMIFFFSWFSLPYLSLLACMVFVIFFAFGFGPVPSLLIAELYPSHLRGKGLGIATAANWFCNTLLSFFFLEGVLHLTLGGMFALFGGVGLIAWGFVYAKVPETKGRIIDRLSEDSL